MPLPISVILPAYNEGKSVGDVIHSVQQVLQDANIESEVIVVDDGSTDATGVTAEDAGAKVYRHTSNRGYGAALKSGILAASYDLIAITDADGTYPIERLPDLIAAMDRADMVVGARTGNHVHVPFFRRPAKWLLTRLASYITQAKIEDLNSGLRVFSRSMA